MTPADDPYDAGLESVPYEEIVPGAVHIPASEFEPVCCRFCHSEFANADWIVGHFPFCEARFPGLDASRPLR